MNDSTGNEQLDALVYGYLERKGYQQTMDTLARESPTFAALRKQAPPERVFINIDDRLKDKTLEQIVAEFASTDRPKWHPSLVDIERHLKSVSNNLTNLIGAGSNQNAHFQQLPSHNYHQVISNANSNNNVPLSQQATHPLPFVAEPISSCQPSNIPQDSCSQIHKMPEKNKAEVLLQPTQDLQENDMDTSIESKDERTIEETKENVEEEQETVTTDAIEMNTLVEAELKAVTTDAVEATLVEEENDEPKTNDAVETNNLKQDGEVQGSLENFSIVDDIPMLYEASEPALSPLPPRKNTIIGLLGVSESQKEFEGLSSSQQASSAEFGINDTIPKAKENSRSDKLKQDEKKKSINADSELESEILSKKNRDSLTGTDTLGKREVAKRQEPNEKMSPRSAPRTRSQAVRQQDKKLSQNQNRQQQGHGGSENGERHKQDLDEKKSLEKMLFQERQKEKAIRDRSSYNKQESFETKRRQDSRHKEDPRINDPRIRRDERYEGRGSGANRKRYSTDVHPSDYLFKELDRSTNATKAARTHFNQAWSDGREKSTSQREKDLIERKSFERNSPASYKQEFERTNDSEPQGYNTSWASTKTERSVIILESCAQKDPRLEASASKKFRAEDVTPQLDNVKQIFSNAVVQAPSIQFRLARLNLQKRLTNGGNDSLYFNVNLFVVIRVHFA
ncbi:unnamed protein product, partial [Mesorhabditis belari]|uniref:LisH domain-containing protein n=1 Tax=Mesorhabditis belari TaxID=2138241 RepID=A0AAF3FMQ7_9BILA